MLYRKRNRLHSNQILIKQTDIEKKVKVKHNRNEKINFKHVVHLKSFLSCPIILSLVLLLVLVNIFLFYYLFIREIILSCKPSAKSKVSKAKTKPLVEYYIHGRGKGHYARSIAIIEKLIQAGVDVTMFVGSIHSNPAATLNTSFFFSNQYHKRLDHIWIKHGILNNFTTLLNSNPIHLETSLQNISQLYGKLRMISVPSTLPGMSIFTLIKSLLLRLKKDCSVAYHAKHDEFPILVISDADIPGILRAKLGSIPSVSISHGNFFSIVDPPSWLSTTARKAWNKQASLNYLNMLFSTWRVGVHYTFSYRSQNNIVAPSRMRRQFLQMKQKRTKSQEFAHFHNLQRFQQRPFILCYFRDDNGSFIINYLLSTGFNVINMLRNSSISTSGNSSNLSKSNNNMSHFYSDEDNTARFINIQDPELFFPLMSMADGIVSSAGSNIITECIFASIPLFTFYLEEDTEQLLNAELMQHYSKDQSINFLFGSSFEAFHNVYSSQEKNQRNSQYLTKDLNSFLQIVNSSMISYIYFQELNNKITFNYDDINLTSFHDHQFDAADIIVDIVNGLKKSK